MYLKGTYFKFWLITCFLWVSFRAFGDTSSCGEVRLDRNGGPFENIPVYDQKRYAKEDTNLCYAVTASQLIDASRFASEEKLNRLTAPLSIALQYKTNQSTLSLEKRDKTTPSDPSQIAASMVGGGFMATAIKSVENQEVCDQNFLQKYDDAIDGHKNLKKHTGDRTTESFLKGILYQVELNEKSVASLEKIKNRNLDLTHSDTCNSPSFDLENTKSILETTTASMRIDSPIVKANSFLKSLCRNNSFKVNTLNPQSLEGFPGDYVQELAKLGGIPENRDARAKWNAQFVDLQNRFDPKAKNDRLAKKINEILDSRKPLGIGYCHDSLSTSETTNCAPAHASVIIGRRFNPTSKSCEYLIRDSYGKSCEENGRPKYSWPCESGSVWIPSDKLLATAANLTWLP